MVLLRWVVIHACNLNVREAEAGGCWAIIEIFEILSQKRETFLNTL